MEAGRPLTYFVGLWKRSLASRIFDNSFALAKDSNCVVSIDVPDGAEGALRWSFGTTSASVRPGCIMAPAAPAAAALPSPLPGDDLVHLRVAFSGQRECYGLYQPSLGVLTVHLVGSTTAVLVYRIVDDNTVAVSVTDTPHTGPPLLQWGFMFRC